GRRVAGGAPRGACVAERHRARGRAAPRLGRRRLLRPLDHARGRAAALRHALLPGAPPRWVRRLHRRARDDGSALALARRGAGAVPRRSTADGLSDGLDRRVAGSLCDGDRGAGRLPRPPGHADPAAPRPHPRRRDDRDRLSPEPRALTPDTRQLATMPTTTARPRTLGALKKSGYRSRSVKDEIRANLIRRLQSGEPLFPGVVGYDDTVIPQVVNALLSRQNFILLGLRGQAKSRIVRQLVALLDEEIPVLEGSEINDDPLRPISKYGRVLVEEHGDDAPIAWVPREARFVEKLATPDVTIADLIGDVDPIRAARGGHLLSDELQIDRKSV